MAAFAKAGGLVSYGSRFADTYYQLGLYTGRLLKGENPAEMPVQQSTKSNFVNLKTAKTLGIAIPNVTARTRRRGDRITSPIGPTGDIPRPELLLVNL